MGIFLRNGIWQKMAGKSTKMQLQPLPIVAMNIPSGTPLLGHSSVFDWQLSFSPSPSTLIVTIVVVALVLLLPFPGLSSVMTDPPPPPMFEASKRLPCRCAMNAGLTFIART